MGRVFSDTVVVTHAPYVYGLSTVQYVQVMLVDHMTSHNDIGLGVSL